MKTSTISEFSSKSLKIAQLLSKTHTIRKNQRRYRQLQETLKSLTVKVNPAPSIVRKPAKKPNIFIIITFLRNYTLKSEASINIAAGVDSVNSANVRQKPPKTFM